VVQRDVKGFIPTGARVDPALWPLQRPPLNFETSVPGVFAIGDVRLDSMKRLAAAVGEGAGAIQNVHQYLAEIRGPGAAQPEPQASQAVPAP
jgi:thioredoxin reductase (NADPH)